jgi:hypothetical protein
VRQVYVGNWHPKLGARRQSSIQIRRVPQRDGGDHKIHCHRVDILFQARAIANRALSVKANGALQRVVSFAFVQSNGYPSAKVWVLQPFQSE